MPQAHQQQQARTFSVLASCLLQYKHSPSLAAMDPSDMYVLRARSAMHAHAWQDDASSTDSQDSTMSVGADSATLPQLALPLQSRRFLVMNRLRLWFHHHERSFVLRSTLPALLGAPRAASATLCCLHWRSWNIMRSTCPEAHRCMRSVWRVTRSEEAALAQYAEARLLVIEHLAFRTWLAFSARCLCFLVNLLQDPARKQEPAGTRRRSGLAYFFFCKPQACRFQARPPAQRAAGWMVEAALVQLYSRLCPARLAGHLCRHALLASCFAAPLVPRLDFLSAGQKPAAARAAASETLSALRLVCPRR